LIINENEIEGKLDVKRLNSKVTVCILKISEIS